MSFAILRHNKIKSVQKGPAIGHNHRLSKDEKANIDPKKSGLNVFFDGEGTASKIEEKLPSKRRKDAVILIEILLTSGPEFFDAMEMDRWKLSTNPKFKEWVQASIGWAKKEFGENVVDVVLHMDESTPHIHVLTVPLTLDGRLCAKELTMRAEMQRRQTDYAKAMKPFGLERGSPAIETKRKHIGLKESPGSGGKAARDAKAQVDLLEKSQAELERVKAELVKVAAEAQSALAIAKARAKQEMQGASEKIKAAENRNEYLLIRNEKTRLALIDSTDEVKKLDEYTKELQAELIATNEKLAVALDEKAVAMRALVESGEKSAALLTTMAGHEAAADQLRKMSGTREAQEAQEAFSVKWKDALEWDEKRAGHGVVVDVCGNQAIYNLGRLKMLRTFKQGEVVPSLPTTEQEKNGVER